MAHLRLDIGDGAELHAGNRARIEAMVKVFNRLFRSEHPVDRAGAVESIMVGLLCDHFRTMDDAVAAVDAIIGDIKDAVKREWIAGILAEDIGRAVRREFAQ